MSTSRKAATPSAQIQYPFAIDAAARSGEIKYPVLVGVAASSSDSVPFATGAAAPSGEIKYTPPLTLRPLPEVRDRNPPGKVERVPSRSQAQGNG